MKYSLRSLMIVVLAGPPALAWLSFSPSWTDFAIRLVIVGEVSVFSFMAAHALPARE